MCNVQCEIRESKSPRVEIVSIDGGLLLRTAQAGACGSCRALRTIFICRNGATRCSECDAEAVVSRQSLVVSKTTRALDLLDACTTCSGDCYGQCEVQQ